MENLNFACKPIVQTFFLSESEATSNGYTLEVDNSPQKTLDEKIQLLNQQSQSIETLTVNINVEYSMESINDRSPIDFSGIQALPNLKEFVMNIPKFYTNRKIAGLQFLKSSNNIQKFTFIYTYNFGSTQIDSLEVVSQLTSLRYLDIQLGKSYFSFEQLDVSKLQNLETINAQGLHSTEFGFNNPQLKHISLTFTSSHYKSLDFLQGLVNSNQLVSLSLDISSNDSKYLNSLSFLSYISQITSLVNLSLNFRNIHYMTYTSRGQMSHYHRGLQTIESIQDLNQLQNLESLELNLSHNLLTDFLPLVTGIFPLQKLQSLEINCSENRESDLQFGYPHIKQVFDRQYSGKLQHYSFE